MVAGKVVPANEQNLFAFPTSFAQRRLWFLEQLAPGGVAYNETFTARFSGTLNVPALEQSFDEIVARHEALRTIFAFLDGEPVQIVEPTSRFELAFEDVQRLGPEDRREAAFRIASADAASPFDLAQAPLFRAKLIRVGEEDHLLHVTAHHIVCDGWSVGVFARELMELYRAFSRGQASPLAPLPIQYPDYAVWQRERLQGDTLEKELAYWRGALAEAPRSIALPTDRPRPSRSSFRGERFAVVISQSLAARLAKLAHAEGATLFMVLLGAFQVLLARLSGQTDVVVGVPVAGRTRPEVEGLIGLFVNTLVLRTDLSDEPTFRELLARLRETTLAAYAHQELPFERLVDALQPERDLGRNPLFNVMFNLQNAAAGKLRLGGVVALPELVDPGGEKFDLTVSLVETEEGLNALWSFSTDLFDAPSIARMADRFEGLLRDVVADPDRPIARLRLLSESERRQLLVDWAATEAPYPDDRCVHELVEAQVDRTPGAPAVVFGGDQLTYAQLETRANRLARLLRARGAGPDRVVGVCLHRSLDLVVALLAVLKSGAAFLPLDPSNPPSRLAFMLEDSDARTLVTEEPLLAGFPSPWPSAICLDRERRQIEEQDGERLATRAATENLAYVIYTSGSTGEPKGTMLQHGGICNRLAWMQDTYRLTPRDRVLQKTSIGFDVSVWEFFWPLIAGSTIVVARPGGQADPEYLHACMADYGVTTAHFVPSMLEAFLAAAPAAPLPALRRVVCSGEALTASLRDRFLARFDVELHNLYGPTEASIDVTAHACKRDGGSGTVPIGRAIANTRVYVLDRWLEPVPVGVVGELWIGGVGLARGYVGRAGLTAERFRPDPYAARPGERLYRSGDLVRFRADGVLEFLGRRDEQVKVRGFRVEPGEIEATLARHPGVREAVVLAREGRSGEQRLVAYLTVGGEPAPAGGELRAHLARTLPEYMLPSAFVVLERLPLTANGKLDRRALPPPEQATAAPETVYQPPRTNTERALAEIWAEVLGVERVGVHDNYFALGGDSLRAIQIVYRAEEQGIAFSVRTLFRSPTIARLSAALAELPETPSRSRTEATAAAAQPLPEWLRIEHRPLLSLFAAGRLAPVDAAAVAVLPDTLPAILELSKAELVDSLLGGVPVLTDVHDLSSGRIGIITLPLFRSQVYSDPPALVECIAEAVRLAGHVGAGTVSLTDLLPSATDYGRDVKAVLDDAAPVVTTGHATTAAAVVLTTGRLLERLGRRPEDERYAFLGLGSIGTASLRLALRCLPHPREIVLCDVVRNGGHLEELREEALAAGFEGRIRCALSHGDVPDEVYGSSLVVGATNVGGLLDPTRLEPGAIVLDDSDPHCFDVDAAIERFERDGDIVFSQAGAIRAPAVIERLRYVPPAVRHLVPRIAFREEDAFALAGCTLSSLLTARCSNLGPTLGLVDGETCLAHYRVLEEEGFDACAPRTVHGYRLDDAVCDAFTRRFGSLSHAR